MSLITSRVCQKISLFISFGKFLNEPYYVQSRNYAARKGYRAKRDKNKVKKVVEKVGFIPHNLRNKEKLLALRPKLKFDDSWKHLPEDDVYFTKYYRWKVYPFTEAVQCHRETHHPDMYNKPTANLHVSIELNMQGEKKTRFVDDFTRMVAIPYEIDHAEERSILVFSKTPEDLDEAREAGAQLTGGVDLIKQIQNGDISLQDFQYFLAHPNILPELVQLRGLMKRKFPNPRNETLGADLGNMVKKFFNGISYTAKKDEYETDFGLIQTVIGSIDMDAKHLEMNFAALINDVYQMKPKRDGVFISRCILWSPPSSEKFKVDHNLYIESKPAQTPDEMDEEETGEKVAL